LGHNYFQFYVLANQLLLLYFTANRDGHLIFLLYCSIEFDRDDELFATAGVSKRIKVLMCIARLLKWLPDLNLAA